LRTRASENTSLLLYVSSRYISWMMPKKGAEDGLREHLATVEMVVEELPLGPSLEVPTTKLEIGEVQKNSLRVGRCRRGLLRAETGRLGTEVTMDKAWAGIDAGKEFHWAHILDTSGKELCSPGSSKMMKQTS
jgi:hypothetical protein